MVPDDPSSHEADVDTKKIAVFKQGEKRKSFCSQLAPFASEFGKNERL